MSENGEYNENTKTVSQYLPIVVELWKCHSARVPHPNIKAYQPILGREGLKRLFKTKTSANNYALAVKMRYISLLKEMEHA